MGGYLPLHRERLVRRAALALFPVFSRFEPDDVSPSRGKVKTENEKKMVIIPKKLVLLEMMEFRPLIAQAGRTLVKHLPKNRARLLWSLPKLDQKDALIPDLYMSYGPWDDETYQLLFVVFEGGFTLDGQNSKETLLCLVDLLKDDRKRSYTVRTFRFRDADHPTLRLIRFSEEYAKLKPKPKKSNLKRKPKPSPQTLGGQALEKLKALTKKDFGKDTQAWKDWVNTHWKIDRG